MKEQEIKRLAEHMARSRRVRSARRGGMARIIRNGWVLLLAGVAFTSLVQAAPVALVQGTVSAPNDAERKYAVTVTERIEHWLKEMGVPYRVVTDEQLSAQTLESVRVAVLTYNPKLPSAELATLKAFTQRGGRLVVFYSNDADLAHMMGLKLGEYLSDPSALRWTRMRFVAGALPGGPAAVYQRSLNIRPVRPLHKRGRILAYWEDVDGKRREPAWVQSSVGFWMTHVLRDDGDTWRKKQLLVALLGVLDPELWPIAADAARQRAETLGLFGSYAETERILRSRAPRTGRAADVAATLTTARSMRSRLETLAQDGRYTEAVAESDALYRILVQAYATTFRLNDLPRRGVWDHYCLGLYPGKWPKTCRELSRHGITDIFVNAAWPGKARYPSKLLPVDETIARYGDPLGDAVAAAHAEGMKVHLWKVCWNLYGAPKDLIATFRKAGRLQRSDEGKELPWLCPSNPDNLRYEKDALREALSRYPVDGVHLDYVRYPGSHACYCNGCRARFETKQGRRVAQWPEDVRSGGKDCKAYTTWRCAQITRLVRDVSALSRQARPGIVLSAAVYGKYPSCVNSVAQDWPGWVNDGLLDFIVPMNYTDNLDRFEEWLDDQVTLIKDDRRLCPGIGVTAYQSRLEVPDVLQQLEAVQNRGAGGIVLFSLNEVLSREILPYLGIR